MKTFAIKEKRSTAALSRSHHYVHHPTGPVQQAQQTIMCKILRPDDMQDKLDVDERDSKHEKENGYTIADLPVSSISGTPPNVSRSTATIHRVENEEAEGELQRQSEEEEEEPVQAKPLL